MGRTPPTPDELLRAFGATEADLALNRQGRLGRGQKRRLWRQVAITAVLTVVLVGGLLAIMLFVADKPIAWWRWLMVAVICLAVLAVAVNWTWKLVALGIDTTVDCHTGPIHAYFAGRAGKKVTVKEITYNINIPLNRLIEGATYEVYVVEGPAIVVAMVPVDAPVVEMS